MDTRVDGQSVDDLDETWVEERTVPDLDRTSIEGAVWPRHARDRRDASGPRSELQWRS